MKDENSILDQHYYRIGPRRFIELREQIQALYDGPWVQMGSYLEDGMHVPVPEDQEMARRMWRNAYAVLKPYEPMIQQDFHDMQLDNIGVFYGVERQAINAMYDLIEAYHNNVELYDIMQRPEREALELFEKTCLEIEARDKEEVENGETEQNNTCLPQWSPWPQDTAVTEPEEVEDPKVTEKVQYNGKVMNLRPTVRDNKEAYHKLVQVLRRDILPIISSTFSWGHVKEAMKCSDIIETLGDKTFGNLICEILTGEELVAANIKSACSRYSTRQHTDADANKVREIQKLLKPVTDLLDSSRNS